MLDGLATPTHLPGCSSSRRCTASGDLTAFGIGFKHPAMVEFGLYLAGHAVASLIVLAVLFLAFQWFTGFPLRWGWRRHPGASIGKVLPRNDRDA
jgi:hypothetical protein